MHTKCTKTLQHKVELIHTIGRKDKRDRKEQRSSNILFIRLEERNQGVMPHWVSCLSNKRHKLNQLFCHLKIQHEAKLKVKLEM